MNKARKVFIFVTFVVLVVTFVGLTGTASAGKTPQESPQHALVLAGGESTNPREYDPATTHGSGDKLAYSGLVAFDPYLNLTPDLAETWDVSSDGTVYTFHLRANAKFHDGRPVTAQDVVYSWERALSPALHSDTAPTYLGDILGADEMTSGIGTTSASPTCNR